jgi:ribonuclease R
MKKQEDELSLAPVLNVLAAQKGRALHVMEVCTRLGIPGHERDRVRRALDLLEEEGRAQQLPGLRFKAVRGRENKRPSLYPEQDRKRAPTARVGVLRVHARGHGFVSLDEGGPDVFVAPPELLGAMHGDRVAVSVRPSDRGFEGTVVAVLSRNLTHVAGLLAEEGRGLVIRPNDARMPRLVNVIGRVPADAVPGLEVVGAITRFPEDGSPPSAEIVRVLGVEGSAEVEVAKIKLREGIREEFAEAVLAEAATFGGRISPKERKGRSDLRHLDLVTIDPLTARDHDDAIFIERLSGGGYRVVVAIADVSHYVREGGAVDEEALARCTSIYLPDRAIPMLPPELSSDLASLVANKDRLTLALDLNLAPNGTVRSFRYVEGLMRCKASLTYEGVAQALGLTKQGRIERAASKHLEMLQVLLECAMILRNRRMKRGSLDFDLPEPFVELDQETGEPKNVQRSRKDPGVRKAYQLVEEMMLLANETVAADLAQRQIPAIYRVHGVPEPDRLEQFAGLARALGFNFDPEDIGDPKELSQFLATLDDTAHKGSLSYLLLRAMQQASYDTTNVGHFGLAAKHYLHFTSPIRRYPDLAVHRVVRKLARGEPIESFGLERKLSEQASAASKLERRAMLVEREVIDVYRCLLVKDRVGDEFEATVTGVAAHGMYCAFDDPFVEALCHVSSLGNDFYEIDKHGLRLVGRRSGASYGLGDRVTVRLESVNVSERAILAAPVIYVHPDDLDGAPHTLDPVHEGGHSRLKRKDKRKVARFADDSSPSERPARASGRSGEEALRQAQARKDEAKRKRRVERRSKDERKKNKRRR